MDHAYVVMSGDRPISTATGISTAQQAAITHHSRYLTESRTYRWDHRVNVQELMIQNERTGRWNKTYVTVHKVPSA